MFRLKEEAARCLLCLESGRYLQGYSRPEPVGQWLK